MPIKITWKSVVGLVTLLAGAITSGAITPATVGGGTPGKILAAIGGALLAFERIADAIDYRSDSQFNSLPGVPPATTAAKPPAAVPPAV
jgi:outer membrane lipoprotein SlyB